ncbi:transglycosylase SLT domain-containing protein [Pelomonas sp. SE-A7]|uniref:transglycosylase SLT domain-containing protein n=1 Tax=Pelomonas sp. SE-A7 TaxID=3054953 RepID=UPI00259C9BA6|nr:transglycosylase SLT domain-containing protein [Pelomonas sp. SE-A7]MDM4765936.1 transglycosylase SLT domain-containing protein [Pelomonas sp. SE-A7]
MNKTLSHSKPALRPLCLALAATLLSACASTQAPIPISVPPQAATPVVSFAAVEAPVVQPTAAPMVVKPAPDTQLLEDSLNPGRKIDLDAPAVHADIWARLRQGFAMPELDNEGVRRAEFWYSERPDYVARMTERGSRYLFHIVEELEKRGMPTELALLPFVESAFVTDAKSRAKAVGMWQFMPATGRDFALKQNIFRDDRRDVLASTRAALDYLERLHRKFGDWHLALAAYNWGQGNVAKAIARNEKAGLATDYESLKMPDETRYYIPKLQAVKNIVGDPARYSLSLPKIANHPYFLSVKIDRDIDVDLAARLAEMELDEFKAFNPQMNKPVILSNGTSQLLLPFDNAGRFVTNLAEHRGQLASWTAWVVPKTMKPADAAKQVGMAEAQLRDINKIPPKMLVKSGSTLLVPRTAKRDQDVSEHLADNAAINLAPDVPPLKKLSYKTGKGESVATVAARYKLPASQVAQWNRVSTKATFKPGQLVTVYLAQLPPSPQQRVASSKKAPVQRPAKVGAARNPVAAKAG